MAENAVVAWQFLDKVEKLQSLPDVSFTEPWRVLVHGCNWLPLHFERMQGFGLVASQPFTGSVPP